MLERNFVDLFVAKTITVRILLAVNFGLSGYCADRQPMNVMPVVEAVRWVEAKAGLIIRDRPARSGESLGLVPHGADVAVLAVSDKNETIDGRPGQWVEIVYTSQRGYVFGGYLSAQPPIAQAVSAMDRRILERLRKLSGIQIPDMPVRSRPWGHDRQLYDPKSFSVLRKQESAHYVAIAIQPDELGCEFRAGSYDCFSILGTRAGNYISSDISGDTIGPVVNIDDRRVQFNVSEGHGGGCSFLGSGATVVHVFAEHRTLRMHFEVGEECPCDCNIAGTPPCACEVKKYSNTVYSENGKGIEFSPELEELFQMPPP